MAYINYEIVRQVGIMAEKQSGWKRTLNLIRWNAGEEKYDIRDWSPDGQKMSKGIVLTRQEAEELLRILQNELSSVARL